jgi:hypothetical protein
MPDEVITKIEETQESTASGTDLLSVLGRESGFAKKPYSNEVRAAFMETLNRAIDGSNLAYYQLKEAMVTADFPYLFGDVLDRSLMAAWGTTMPSWRNYIDTGTVRDFRQAKLLGIEGMGAVLDGVGERAEYPERGPSEETPITRQVSKYGGRFGISFEAMINDDLGALRTLPQKLVEAARRTEALAASKMYVGTAGFNTALYKDSAGFGNIVNTTNGAASTNPALSLANLAQAFLVLGNHKDLDGFPIVMDAVSLVVGPALRVTANNIINATEIMVASGGGAYNAVDQIRTANWMRNNLTVEVDPYIGMTATSNAATTWFLFASKGAPRTAVQMDYLVGHESPELFVKTPNASRVGGGTVPESFENDQQEYKVRHIFGLTQVAPYATVASNGSGS